MNVTLTEEKPRTIVQTAMRIAPKIVLLFLPLLIGPMVFVAVTASVSARSGITDVATSLLQFKAEELARYATSQYQLLEQNNLLQEQEFVDASRQSIASHAQGLVRRESELVLAADDQGEVAFTTEEVALSEEEQNALAELVAESTAGWQQLSLGGTSRVGYVVPFEPFGWSFLITDATAAFYSSVDTIFRRSSIILVASLLATTLLLILFSGYITRPLKQIVQAMRDIVETGELSRRVKVQFDDETGELGSNFNRMTSALEHAYGEIKNYALQAAVAERREKKIRHVFQKYVPNQVIEQFFASPESMLVGQERELAILFSDIRGFTTLSEGLSPSNLVESLNRYFSKMVEVIMQQQGVVDKYIGDAIMAFFGAPAPDEESCFHAVSAALDMLDALNEFNRTQKTQGRPVFKIGIGINYGDVTIGNIGSEKKMDYTVIGDMVNLASRLEGLNKSYMEPIIISEPVQQELDGRIPARMIDRVVVKGKSRPVAIFGVRRELSESEEEAWKLHSRGLELYYGKDFPAAADHFKAELQLLPEDKPAQIFLQRCEKLMEQELPQGWTGVVTLTEK
jgi:class 3 adenylate cyclase/HAMP domain-containing protein